MSVRIFHPLSAPDLGRYGLLLSTLCCNNIIHVVIVHSDLMKSETAKSLNIAVEVNAHSS